MEDTENQREDEGLKQSLTSDINSLQEHRDVSVSEWTLTHSHTYTHSSHPSTHLDHFYLTIPIRMHEMHVQIQIEPFEIGLNGNLIRNDQKYICMLKE
jgi:hypothetical protein